MSYRVTLAVALAASLAACAGPRAPKSGRDASAKGADRKAELAASRDPQAVEASLRGKAYQTAPELATVRFPYDSVVLDDEARARLKENAAWLKKLPKIEIQIQGHCDERGTTAYNLALGQRRATAVREYYKDLGIPMKRMSTISFGEERPECSVQDEECWARNRRAQTLARVR